MERHKDEPESPYETRRVAARILKVSEKTLDKLTREGRVPAVQLGPRTIRYRRDVLLSFGK